MLQPLKRPRLAHIPELDGVRGIAALMVLCHHLFFTSVPDPERWNGFVLFLSRISRPGETGVDVFFVLSGFLITSLLLLDRGDPNYYWNFYWKRALRVLPLYLIALLCLVSFSPHSWRYVLLSLFFIANFAPAFHVASSGPFWTLAIEEQFYLIWPRFARGFNVATLETLAIALVIASTVLRLAAAAVGHHNYLFTFFHCDGLALGAVLACQQHRADSEASPAARRNLRLLLFLVAIFLTALPSLLAIWLDPESSLFFAALALQLTGVNLVSYSVIAAAVYRSGSPLLAIFRSRTLTFFGLISYCLYISSSYVVVGYDRLFGPMQPGNMPQYETRAAVIIAATLVVCVLSRYVLELPAMSLRRYVLRASSGKQISDPPHASRG